MGLVAGASEATAFADEDEICRTFAPRLRAVARRWAAGPADADDLAHDVLIVVLEAIREGRVEGPEAIPGYAFGVMQRLALASVRKDARRADLKERFFVPPEEVRAPSGDASKLTSSLHALPLREKEIILRSYAQGQSAEVIATELGLTAGNVRVVKHRAVARLRRLMKGTEEE